MDRGVVILFVLLPKTLDLHLLSSHNLYVGAFVRQQSLVEKANSLVDSLLSGTYAPMLHLMYDYDACTYTHTKNVTLLALLAAIEMQYSVDDLRNIALGTILHDIGKLEVPLYLHLTLHLLSRQVLHLGTCVPTQGQT